MDNQSVTRTARLTVALTTWHNPAPARLNPATNPHEARADA